MTSLVFAAVVPTTIWLQNKPVEVGLWGYPAGKAYWLGWITRQGDGPFQWSRHLWLGNDMPVMEYLFYPAFCFWQVTLYAWLAAHFLFPNPRAMDYAYWMMGFGFGITWAAWLWSPGFRAYTASPAFCSGDFSWRCAFSRSGRPFISASTAIPSGPS